MFFDAGKTKGALGAVAPGGAGESKPHQALNPNQFPGSKGTGNTPEGAAEEGAEGAGEAGAEAGAGAAAGEGAAAGLAELAPLALL